MHSNGVSYTPQLGPHHYNWSVIHTSCHNSVLYTPKEVAHQWCVAILVCCAHHSFYSVETQMQVENKQEPNGRVSLETDVSAADPFKMESEKTVESDLETEVDQVVKKQEENEGNTKTES